MQLQRATGIEPATEVEAWATFPKGKMPWNIGHIPVVP
jgi:hypothetical protein